MPSTDLTKVADLSKKYWPQHFYELFSDFWVLPRAFICILGRSLTRLNQLKSIAKMHTGFAYLPSLRSSTFPKVFWTLNCRETSKLALLSVVASGQNVSDHKDDLAGLISKAYNSKAGRIHVLIII